MSDPTCGARTAAAVDDDVSGGVLLSSLFRSRTVGAQCGLTGLQAGAAYASHAGDGRSLQVSAIGAPASPFRPGVGLYDPSLGGADAQARQLTARPWPGRHALGGAAAIIGGRVRLDSSMFTEASAPVAGSWACVAALRVPSSGLVGGAAVKCGTVTLLGITSDRDVYAGDEAGYWRTAPAAAPSDAVTVIAAWGRVGVGYQLYVDGVRVDSENDGGSPTDALGLPAQQVRVGSSLNAWVYRAVLVANPPDEYAVMSLCGQLAALCYGAA